MNDRDIIQQTIEHANSKANIFKNNSNMISILSYMIEHKWNFVSREYQNKILVLCDKINEDKINYILLYNKLKIFILGTTFLNLKSQYKLNSFITLSNNISFWPEELIKIVNQYQDRTNAQQNEELNQFNKYNDPFDDLMKDIQYDLNLDDVQNFVVFEEFYKSIDFIMNNI